MLCLRHGFGLASGFSSAKKLSKPRMGATEAMEERCFCFLNMKFPTPEKVIKMHQKQELGGGNSNIFPQQQNAMGSLHNIDFGCVLGKLGRFREGTGFREPVPGTGSGNPFWVTGSRVRGTSFGNRTRVSMGSDRFCGSKVPVQGRLKEVSKVSVFDQFRGARLCSRDFGGTDSGNRVPGTRGIKKVPGQGFRQLLCTLKIYSCSFKVYLCTLKVCFCTLKVYLLCFASILFYIESMLLCFESTILYLESMLLYVESICFVI